MSEFFKRVFVAIIGIPLTIVFIFLGGIYFTTAIAIISTIATLELFKMFEKKGLHPFKKITIFANLLLTFTTYLYLNSLLLTGGNEILLISLLMIIIFIFLLTALWTKKTNVLQNLMISLGVFFYISVTFIFLILLREFSTLSLIINNKLTLNTSLITGKEPEFFLSLLIAIWLCDTAAYMIGSAIGKHKLFPKVSPKKTWEGAISGFFAAILGFVLCTQIPILIKNFPIQNAIVIGVIIGTIGQIGDLVESKIKRDIGIKDSSDLLPGHGGVLDRFDSIMFVVPSIFIYLFIITNL